MHKTIWSDLCFAVCLTLPIGIDIYIRHVYLNPIPSIDRVYEVDPFTKQNIKSPGRDNEMITILNAVNIMYMIVNAFSILATLYMSTSIIKNIRLYYNRQYDNMFSAFAIISHIESFVIGIIIPTLSFTILMTGGMLVGLTKYDTLKVKEIVLVNMFMKYVIWIMSPLISLILCLMLDITIAIVSKCPSCKIDMTKYKCTMCDYISSYASNLCSKCDPLIEYLCCRIPDLHITRPPPYDNNNNINVVTTKV